MDSGHGGTWTVRGAACAESSSVRTAKKGLTVQTRYGSVAPSAELVGSPRAREGVAARLYRLTCFRPAGAGIPHRRLSFPPPGPSGVGCFVSARPVRGVASALLALGFMLAAVPDAHAQDTKLSALTITYGSPSVTVERDPAFDPDVLRWLPGRYAECWRDGGTITATAADSGSTLSTLSYNPADDADPDTTGHQTGAAGGGEQFHGVRATSRRAPASAGARTRASPDTAVDAVLHEEPGRHLAVADPRVASGGGPAGIRVDGPDAGSRRHAGQAGAPDGAANCTLGGVRRRGASGARLYGHGVGGRNRHPGSAPDGAASRCPGAGDILPVDFDLMIPGLGL